MLCFQENQNFSMLPRGTVGSYILLRVGRTAVREGWEFINEIADSLGHGNFTIFQEKSWEK